ncbi:MAG: tetratricopeptide repeat protein, partial [Kiloniellaceae bacterium]
EAILQTDKVDEALGLASGAVSDFVDDARVWQVYSRALLAARDDLDQAVHAAERAVHIAPTDPGALLTLAQVAELQGDEARSETLRRDAMELAPHWAEPALAAAFLALDRGDNASATATFSRALRANPLDTEAWQGRALAREYEGAYASAARSVEYLTRLQPRSEEFRAWGRRLRLFGERPDVATTRSAKAAQLALDHVPPVSSGLTPETRQDLITALGAMDHALHLRPDAVALWCLKGELLTALEQPGDAAGCYAHAAELDPDSGAAWLGLARARLAQGDEAAGMDGIMRAMSARRPMPAAGLLGAELHWRQGRRGPALRLLAFTLAMAPAWAPAWRRMAEWAERLDHYRMVLRAGRALSALPGHRTAGLLIMARQMVRIGMLDEARAVCEDALASQDDGADTWAILAEVQHARGDVAAARRSWERALERDAGRADLWCAYAQTLMAAGDTRSAAAVVQRATRLAPDTGHVWRMAGEVHLRGGQSWLARRAFGRALKLEPTDAARW